MSKVIVAFTCLSILSVGVNITARASSTATFTGPAYSSADCTPNAGGLGPQQWNSGVGLPLIPKGTPLPQRLVIGEFDETASQSAVSNLLIQCGIADATLLSETRPWGGTTAPGAEATLDATVIAAALPKNASITMVNVSQTMGYYGMLVSSAYACGFTFNGDPTAGLTSIRKSSSFPLGGCIISISYGGAESEQSPSGLKNSDYMMDQLARQGVIVVVAVGDEGSGGCISSGGNPFGDAVPASVISVELINNVATLTTSAAHGFNVAQTVYLAGISEPFQGLFKISATTSTTFSFGLPDVNIPAVTLPEAGVAYVNFGGLTPQYLATNPNALSVGGTQWDSQVTSMEHGFNVKYVPGATYQNYVWKDSFPNPNCANLSGFPNSGGQGTGGGQSAVYSMPRYQSSAARASYPGATNFRMIPDVAALAGWPAYAIANWGLGVSGKALNDTEALISTSGIDGIAVGELVTVTGAGVPFDGTFTVTGTPYNNAFTYTIPSAITITTAALASNVATITTGAPHGLAAGQIIDVVGATNSVLDGTFVVAATPTTTTFTYARVAEDIAAAPSAGYINVRLDFSAPTGWVSAGCIGGGTPPCPAADFPWVPVAGTSAATPLIAVGIANVNAVLSARGMAPIDNAGGAMDVHSIFYSSANASAMTDVVNGNNEIMGLGGWNALPGYDMVSGMGVPNFGTLANLIIARSKPIIIAAGVEVSGGSTITDVGVVNVSSTGVNVARAPSTNTQLGRWTSIRFAKQQPKALVKAYVRVEGSWVEFGEARANRSGAVIFPALRLTKSGIYPIRIKGSGVKYRYFTLYALSR